MNINNASRQLWMWRLRQQQQQKLCLDKSTHVCSSRQDTENSAQRDYDLPILSIMGITGDLGVPGYLWKFGQGSPPRVCVFVCVLGGFRGQSPRSNNPPHLGFPGGPHFLTGVTSPPWLMMWVVEGCEKNYTRGYPLWFRGGGGGWGWFYVAPTPLTNYFTPLPSTVFRGQSPYYPNLPPHKCTGGHDDDNDG